MFRAVDFLHVFVKLDGLTTLGFSAGAGLIFFEWPLGGVLLRIFLEYFTLLRGVSRAMQQACFSALVVLLFGETDYFVLNLLSQPFSGLVGKANSTTFILLTLMSRLASYVVFF